MALTRVNSSLVDAGSIIQVQTLTLTTNTTVTNDLLTAIPGMSFSFTPKRANSKILLMAQVTHNNVYVTSLGFLKGTLAMTGVVATAGVAGTNGNGNAGGSVTTVYHEGTVSSTRTSIKCHSFMLTELAGDTSVRTYAVGASSSWAGVAYPLTINNRENNDMQSYSTFTIWEIAQ